MTKEESRIIKEILKEADIVDSSDPERAKKIRAIAESLKGVYNDWRKVFQVTDGKEERKED